jgi:hypothetical protein
MSFNSKGTTISFGGSVNNVRSIRRSKSVDELDITTLQSEEKEFEAGFSESEVTIEVLGILDYDTDDEGSLVITFPSPWPAKDIGNCKVMRIEDGAQVGNALTTNVTFKRTAQ